MSDGAASLEAFVARTGFAGGEGADGNAFVDAMSRLKRDNAKHCRQILKQHQPPAHDQPPRKKRKREGGDDENEDDVGGK